MQPQTKPQTLGYDWEGNFTHCWGAVTAVLLDSQLVSVAW